MAIIFKFNLAGGLVWISQWNSLQHPVASAFLAAIYSDYMLSSRTEKISCNGRDFRPSDLRKFALSQVHLPSQSLGKNLYTSAPIKSN